MGPRGRSCAASAIDGVSPYIQDAGNRGVWATIHRLGASGAWNNMENIDDFVASVYTGLILKREMPYHAS